MDYSFRHLDPSVTKTYAGTVLYGFEMPRICYLLKVNKGYVTETPVGHDNRAGHLGWIRGQHITTLEPYFEQIKPIRIVSDGY